MVNKMDTERVGVPKRMSNVRLSACKKPADYQRACAFVTPQKTLRMTPLDGVPFSTDWRALRERHYFAAGRLAYDGTTTNEEIDPASFITDHFGDDYAVADIDRTTPLASGLLPYPFVPTNDVRLDKRATARNPLRCHALRLSVLRRAHFGLRGKKMIRTGTKVF